LHFDKIALEQKLPGLLGGAVLNVGTKRRSETFHAQVHTFQKHCDNNLLKLEGWIEKQKFCGRSILFGPVASQDFYAPCPSIHSHWKQLQSYSIFLCLCPFLPNEEDTILSGNLLAYFKCDGAKVSKVNYAAASSVKNKWLGGEGRTFMEG